MRLHLHIHALRHLGDIYESRWIVSCQCLRQTVYMIFYCFIEAIKSLVDHFQFLFVMTSTAFASIWTTASRAKARVQTRWFEGDIFRLLPAWEEEEDVRWCFLHLSCDVGELSPWFWCFLSCHLPRKLLPLNISSKMVAAKAEREQAGDDVISLVTGGSGLSSSYTALIINCLTKAGTGAIEPKSLTIFSIRACITMSDRNQLSNLWLNVSSRTPQ